MNVNVKIEMGFGWINGYLYSVYDEVLMFIVQFVINVDRIDRVIFCLDISMFVWVIRVMILQGNFVVFFIVLVIICLGDIYDFSLVQILVKFNILVVFDENIIDECFNSVVCGVVIGLI